LKPIDHADPCSFGEIAVSALLIRLSRLSGGRVPGGNTIDSPSMRRSSGPTKVGRIEIVALASRSGAA
jgi:hypothetical protein